MSDLLDYLDLLLIKYLYRRGAFTKIESRVGVYYDSGFEIQNKSDENKYVLVLTPK